MEILILGGTGAIGTYVCEELKKKQCNVYVTSRRAIPNSDNINYYQGNALDNEFIVKVLNEKKWDIVLDFMVYKDEMFSKRLEFILSKVTHYIYISSARVFNNTYKLKINEKSELISDFNEKYEIPDTDYPIIKCNQERFIEKQKNNNWTILRPYITYDSNRLQLGPFEKEDWLYRALNGKAIVLPNCIMDAKTTLTSGKDVARIIALLLFCDGIKGESYNIASTQSVTWKEVVEIYLQELQKELGYKPRIILQRKSEFYKYNSHVPIEYDRIYERTFDISKLINKVGEQSFIQVETGLADDLKAFLSNIKFGKINWKAEAYKDKHSNNRESIFTFNNLKCMLKYFLFRYIIR